MKTRFLPSRFLLTILLLAAGGCGASDPAGIAIVGRDVDQAVALRGEARVVVAFEPDVRGRVAPVADALLHHAGRPGFRLGRRFAATPILAGTVDDLGLARLREDPSVLRIDLDAPVYPLLAEAVPLVRLDLAHVEGYDGSGVTVGVIDTGIQTDHPDLSDSLVGEACFCSGGCCHNGADTDFGPGSAEDLTGHGTHVSGIVTSNGIVAPAGGAPAAEIVAVKVLDGDENNQVSDVIAALDWIYTDRPDVDVVNISLGSSALFAGVCDSETAWTIGYAAAVQNLLSREVLVFSASGNDGSKTEMVAPACIDRVISVGGVWEGDYPTLGPFGSSGCVEADPQPDLPVCFGNSNSETDLYAPAGIITSTDIRASGTRPRVGTSQAAPLAAACAAVLRQLDPGVTATEIETLLEASSTTVVEPESGLTFPRLDCYEALYSLGDPDGDQVLTPSDNCPAIANAAQEDADRDSRGDLCDPCPNDADDDVDSDTVCGDLDNCPDEANTDQSDGDGDGRGDVCDACPADPQDDIDGDAICAERDNCPMARNPDQDDDDGDGAGNACDPCPLDEQNDVDDDGICGDQDNCPGAANTNQADADGDGTGDACDFCPLDEQNDADDDGICGDQDNCPMVVNTSQADADRDGVGDACEARQPRSDAGCDCASGRFSTSLGFLAALAIRRRRRQSRTQ